MANRRIFLWGLFALAAARLFSFEIYDLNGTWAGDIRHLESPLKHRAQYSWGSAATIPNSTFDIEVEKTTALFMGNGRIFFSRIEKENEDTISIIYHYIEDNERKRPKIMRVHFADYNTFWFEEIQPEMIHGVGSEASWYRMSGPGARKMVTGVANDSKIRIRMSPDLRGKVLGHLEKGDEITVIGLTEKKEKIDGLESSWHKVKTTAGLEGWVYGAYLDLEEHVIPIEGRTP
jgi:hypothetical protein